MSEGAKYPVITLTGPRKSGKSTLAKMLYPDYTYVSLETPDVRVLAQTDPRSFFKQYPFPLILDEVQRVPALLSFIQTFVDEIKFSSQCILSGSNQFLLMEKITQSLAGRSLMIKLLPFSYSEMMQIPQVKEFDLDTLMFTGSYPRIYDKNLLPHAWLAQYEQTYIERDVRDLLNVGQLDLFFT